MVLQAIHPPSKNLGPIKQWFEDQGYTIKNSLTGNSFTFHTGGRRVTVGMSGCNLFLLFGHYGSIKITVDLTEPDAFKQLNALILFLFYDET